MKEDRGERGFALVSVLLLAALLMVLGLAHFVLTSIELSSTKSSMDSTRGFYAAEAGLNLRADAVRATFVGYNRPSGTSPNDSPGYTPCATGNEGSGDYACIDYALLSRTIATYLKEPTGNPTAIVIPRGEAYQNLHAQEYRYQAFSTATGLSGHPEAILELRFKSRLVPMFQFMAFYNKDLEILPGATFDITGPIHTNGDLYLGTHASMDMDSQVTSVRTMYRGRKDENLCMTGAVTALDPDDPVALPPCSGTRRTYSQIELDPWNGMLLMEVDSLTVPEPEDLEPDPGNAYWDLADLRVMLDLNGATPAIEIRQPGGSPDATKTADLATCAGATDTTNTFYNNREGKVIRMLEVDLEKLLDCVELHALLGAGKGLDDTTEGGLVFYFGFDAPGASGVNHYGVRVKNGAEIRSTVAGTPDVVGLTVVTDQAMYIQGDYNVTNKKPASFLADSLNVLSNAWDDSKDTLHVDSRVASNTTIQAAFMSGTDSTGGAEGAAGRDHGGYNGGLENYPRFHEKWSGKTFTYVGSFVSLYAPRHVAGAWVYGHPQYKAPNRAWSFDVDFEDAANLPPLSPRFVYLKQDLFVRKF